MDNSAISTTIKEATKSVFISLSAKKITSKFAISERGLSKRQQRIIVWKRIIAWIKRFVRSILLQHLAYLLVDNSVPGTM